MLRDVPTPTEPVSKTYPIFEWKFCQCCKKQFLREWGWKYYSKIIGRLAIYNYICYNCGQNSKSYVAELAYKLKYNKPPHPEPPPKPPGIIRKESQAD